MGKFLRARQSVVQNTAYDLLYPEKNPSRGRRDGILVVNSEGRCTRRSSELDTLPQHRAGTRFPPANPGQKLAIGRVDRPIPGPTPGRDCPPMASSRLPEALNLLRVPLATYASAHTPELSTLRNILYVHSWSSCINRMRLSFVGNGTAVIVGVPL